MLKAVKQWRALSTPPAPTETLLLPQVPTAITEMEISVKRVRAAMPLPTALFSPSLAQSLLKPCCCLLESPCSRPWVA